MNAIIVSKICTVVMSHNYQSHQPFPATLLELPGLPIETLQTGSCVQLKIQKFRLSPDTTTPQLRNFIQNYQQEFCCPKMCFVSFFVSIHPSIHAPWSPSVYLWGPRRLHFRAVELRRQRSWSGATEVYRKVETWGTQDQRTLIYALEGSTLKYLVIFLLMLRGHITILVVFEYLYYIEADIFSHRSLCVPRRLHTHWDAS